MKQRCESGQFIVINDNLKRFARDVYIREIEGEREQGSRETESLCARGRALQGGEDSVGNKIDR